MGLGIFSYSIILLFQIVYIYTYIHIRNGNSIRTSKVSHVSFAPFEAKLNEQGIKIWFKNTRNISILILNVYINFFLRSTIIQMYQSAKGHN